MQRIIDRFAATECAFVSPNDLPILPAFQSICVGTDLNRTTNRASINRVTVVIEPDQTGLGHRCRDRVESIKGADIWDQAGALFLEHFPDGLVAHLGMFVRLGVGDAAILKPSIQFSVGFELLVSAHVV